MTNDDNNIDPLQALWTSNAAPLDDNLAQRAAKSLARQKQRLRLEVIATAGVIAFWVLMLWLPGVGHAATMIAAASAAGLTFWWLGLLLNYRGTWVNASTALDTFVGIERKRLLAERRLTHMSLLGVVVFVLALCMVLPPLILDTHAEGMYREEPWRLAIAGAILLVVLVASAVHGARTRKRIDAALAQITTLE